MQKIKLIYLMGAGRSGTTALATFLGASSEIQVLGEMHQFFEHIYKSKTCSCNCKLINCEYWGKVLELLPQELIQKAESLNQMECSVEAHSTVLHHLIHSNNFKNSDLYLSSMAQILQTCQQVNDKEVLLDSAKFISRALALRNIEKIDLKVIYMVRDVRGVVHSFAKKVQTSRGTLSSIVYYLIVNIVAEISCRLGFKGKYIKVRYEDMMSSPVDFFNELEDFLGIDLENTKHSILNDKEFEIGHIIGGNRLKNNSAIKFNADNDWKKSRSKFGQVLTYLCALPIMILNRYPIYHKG
ncbi:MAG: sulfotransferase [Kordiimonadaceae bacterium]|nr:sulfotransferase [Kordiimonadaceae bacterium]